VAALLDAFLSALSTRPAAALLTTPTVVLYSAGPAPNIGQVLANYTLADFSGYAAQTLTLAGPVNIGLTIQAMVGSVQFVATAASPFVGQTILGYLVVTGGTTMVGGEQFTTAPVIANPGDFVGINVQLPLGAVQVAK
jgi:hypothetical protein